MEILKELHKQLYRKLNRLGEANKNIFFNQGSENEPKIVLIMNESIIKLSNINHKNALENLINETIEELYKLEKNGEYNIWRNIHASFWTRNPETFIICEFNNQLESDQIVIYSTIYKTDQQYPQWDQYQIFKDNRKSKNDKEMLETSHKYEQYLSVHKVAEDLSKTLNLNENLII